MVAKPKPTRDQINAEIANIDNEIKALQKERKNKVRDLARARGPVNYADRKPTEAQRAQNAARAEVRAQKGRAQAELKKVEAELGEVRRRASRLPLDEQKVYESQIASLEEKQSVLKHRVAILTERLKSEFGYTR